MAQFRVGQRVRIVGAVALPQFIGMEATVIGPLRDAASGEIAWRGHDISIDGIGSRDPNTGRKLCFRPSNLAPLTDPSADAFLARLKKLGSEPVNDAPKVTVREGK